ncbi:MAG TPA: MFS transporter [Anaerolineae bacterium]|nr:MFS transporter [Anaerolineae bacterium]
MTAEAKSIPFVALQHRDFRLLWVGQLISQAGSMMQVVAINWHISVLTNYNPLALGLVGLSRVVPIIFFSLVGGAVADAHDRRKVMLITQAAMAIFAAMLGLLTDRGLQMVWPIYLLNALAASASAFDSPARQALIPSLVPREHLANALSLNSIMFDVATIIGPMLAGLIIGVRDVAIVYWINAISFLAVIGALLIMHPARQEIRRTASLSAVKEGLRFVFRQPIVRSTMLLDFFATFFSSANQLLPIFAAQILQVGAIGYGLLTAASAIGSLIAGSTMGFITRIRKPGAIILWAVAIYGLATLIFGISRSFVISLLMLATTGASDTVSMILRQTIRQVVTPDELRGRMTSVNMIFFMGGPQLGELEAGLVAALFSAPLSVITGGIGCLIAVGVTAWKAPTLRKFDEDDLKQANAALVAAGK